jgi:hypothetical protein
MEIETQDVCTTLPSRSRGSSLPQKYVNISFLSCDCGERTSELYEMVATTVPSKLGRLPSNVGNCTTVLTLAFFQSSLALSWRALPYVFDCLLTSPSSRILRAVPALGPRIGGGRMQGETPTPIPRDTRICLALPCSIAKLNYPCTSLRRGCPTFSCVRRASAGCC